jgi:putative AbiEi antitoxin of type IV toxin-antitoxin system
MPSWFSDDTVLLDCGCPLPLDQPFTAATAAALGVSGAQLRRLVTRGLVRRVCRGVYAVAQAPDDLAFRARSLALVVSPSAVVTDRTAAWLHGVDILPRSAVRTPPRISVFQRPGTRSRREGVASGERMLLPRDIVEVGGLAVTSPLRTALDLGRLLWRYDALGALDQFLRLGVALDELLTEIERFKGFRGVVQLRALAPLADPRAESLAESALRLRWYDAGLPRPEPQWWVCDEHGTPIFRLDLALPEVLFAAEYDGVDFHTAEEDRDFDRRRREWLTECRGWLIEVFVNDDLYRPGADPGPRLLAGRRLATATLASRTSYPTLRAAPRRN